MLSEASIGPAAADRIKVGEESQRGGCSTLAVWTLASDLRRKELEAFQSRHLCPHWSPFCAEQKGISVKRVTGQRAAWETALCFNWIHETSRMLQWEASALISRGDVAVAAVQRCVNSKSLDSVNASVSVAFVSLSSCFPTTFWWCCVLLSLPGHLVS